MPSFMELYSVGSVRADAVDDYINNWNNRDDLSIELHTFLGMTESEYMTFIIDPASLPRLLEKRNKKK